MWAEAIVLVQQSIQTQVGSIQDIPKNLLANLVIGQRLEAVVMTSSLIAELASIKVADSLLEIRSPVALQAGQKVQLEVVLKNGEAVLTLLPPVNKAEPVVLKPGQQVAVEVIKVLAENRVLVQVQVPSTNESNRPAANIGNKLATPSLTIAPQTIDIDVSKLSQHHKVGDKLVMDVVSLKPLNVQLRPEPAMPREQIILERIRQLLPQQLTSPSLNKVMTSFQNQKLPDVIQKAVQQLVQHTVNKSDLTKGNGQVFKQAVVSSGVVMEQKLLTQPNQKTQDFKANLLHVLKAVETVITENKGQVASNKAINKLPAQVQEALATKGKTPTQLLNVLLSGSRVPALLSGLTTPVTTPSIISQQQATSLVALLTKPFVPSQQNVSQQAVSRHISMDLIELMQLFKEVEGVHNKLQLNQLNMLKEAEPTSTVASWLFDVPIKDKQTLDLLQVQIDQHKKTSEDDDETWNVKLRLDTQNLGPVQATVTLQNDDVKVIIRAERQESADLLEDNLVLLNEAMAKLGISMSHSSCSCGAVAKAINLGVENENTTDSLLDVSV